MILVHHVRFNCASSFVKSLRVVLPTGEYIVEERRLSNSGDREVPLTLVRAIEDDALLFPGVGAGHEDYGRLLLLRLPIGVNLYLLQVIPCGLMEMLID